MGKFFFILILLVLSLFYLPVNNVRAASSYYVDPTGSDFNTGSLASPFRTFSRAVSYLHPGDTLNLLPGIYNESLRIPSTISGISGSPITIKSLGTQKAIIDMRSSNQNAVLIEGSFINLSDIETENVSGNCIRIPGNNIVLSRLKIHDCSGHGIEFAGKTGSFTGSEIYMTALFNKPKTISAGWAAGLKISAGENITVERNNIHNNYGEGISLRGKHLSVKNNTLHDNYSANIYIGNSYDVWTESNFAYCSLNAEFYRNSNCANNITLSEDYFSGWGSNLGNITIINNILFSGFRGINYSGHESGITEPGLKGALIANNTVWGSTEKAVYFADETYNHDIRFYNNIVYQKDGLLAEFIGTNGISKDYNFWVGTPKTLINAGGAHDKIGDAGLLIVPNYQNPLSFRLEENSSAVNAALFFNEVKNDFSGAFRGAYPDMGALEYGAISPTPTPIGISSTPTPVPSVISPTLSLPSATISPAPTGAGKRGDANHDGKVDGVDYVIWLNNYNLSTANGSYSGDFDGNGFVDGIDYVIWLTNYSF